ncbi:MAG: DUF2298 domain-containing protein [Anaerolineales bacterium]
MIVAWWLVASLLGLLAFPLTYRIFHRLPDRGYAFARPLGLLGASYVLWLGASVELIPNNLGGAVGALIVLGSLSLWAMRGKRKEITDWIKANRRTLIGMEVLFGVSFLVWAFVRANNPEIQFTEKPMELAFLNGVLRSESFPPVDPWLSGYGISYYYFGYVMISLLTQLTGASSGMAFNLASALWFAMVATGSYSILYNLLAARAGGTKAPNLLVPLLAPLFVLVAGNLEGFLDVLYSRQLFWQQLPSGEMQSSFWTWLDIKQLSDPPTSEVSWIPNRFLWWWRASRVVRDVNLAGVDIEVIDEFPFFSFLLADNHPHLLAIPYALMAVAFSFQVYLGGKRGELRLAQSSISRERLTRAAWVIGGIVLSLILLRGILGATGSEALSALEAVQRASVEALIAVVGLTLGAVFLLVLIGVLPVSLRREEFVFSAWLFGSLAFLNTWDSPIYLALLIAALAWVSRRDRFSLWAPRLLYTGLSLGAAAILLYLPWYPSFASQASGIVANVMFPTRIQQFVVMFGVSFIPIVVWLIWRGWGKSGHRALIWKVGLGIPLLLLIVALLFGAANYATVIGDPILLENALRGLGASGSTVQEGIRAVLKEGLQRRLLFSGTVLVLGLTLGVSTWLFVVAGKESEQETSDTVWPFAILLIGVGALLVLTPEFVYLRDLFGTRMNTVFKFYYSAWILWGLAAAYACVELWPASIRLRQIGKVAVFFPLVLGLVYPLLATWTKTNGFNPGGGRTLDGTAYLASQSTADYDAIQWINDNLPGGVIAEAIGGSYSQYARVSTHTGLPTVLGWGGHEVQWRGDAEPQGSRQADIQRLYETSSWPEAAELLDQYGIDYVYVGPLELSTYLRLDEGKFEIFMDKVFDNGSVRIYSRGSTG